MRQFGKREMRMRVENLTFERLEVIRSLKVGNEEFVPFVPICNIYTICSVRIVQTIGSRLRILERK